MDQIDEIMDIPELVDVFGTRIIALIYEYMNEHLTPCDSELFLKWSTLERKFGSNNQYFPEECKELYDYFKAVRS